MRPNDLVWNYWVNNYLLGKRPPAFDILAWNADQTNLPAGLHAQFLDVFEHNSFAHPGSLTALGTPVDLGRVKCDAYVTGGLSDHLTPWEGCYRTTQLLGGSSTFVLTHTGHIQTMVNPPGNPKAHYYVGPEPGPDPHEWRTGAEKRAGSWWEHWAEWMLARSGEDRPAPAKLGSRRHPVLDPAPGRYVLEPA
jgi:polyhydroxyalkanoate synthase